MIVRSIVAFGSDLEHSAVSINWVIPFKTRLYWDIPGYPRLSISFVQGYPVISHLVSSYPLKRYPSHRISQDIPRQDSCFGISHYKFSVLGYPGLSRDKHQVGLSQDIPGYPLWSFFQMQVLNECRAFTQQLLGECRVFTPQALGECTSTRCKGWRSPLSTQAAGPTARMPGPTRCLLA